MIDGLKPYSEYIDSGLSWLGRIPSHWDIRRGKSLFRCVDVRSQAGNEELLTVSSDRGVVPRSTANVTMFKAESYAGHKLCWPGDLVINSLWAWGRGLGVSQHHGIVSTAYGVYRPRDPLAFHGGYIHALVRSSPFNWELTVRSKGIWISRLQLTDQAFLSAPFPVPPLDEQAAIARFLDHVDGRIRRYIRAKRRLSGLLEEQKQAIIHRAVTCGLEPNVHVKPFGAEWLGQFPAHWDRVPIKRLLSKVDYGTSQATKAEGTVRVLTMGNIQGGEVTDAAFGWLTDIPAELLLEHHDLLFTRTNGNPDLVGKIGIFRGQKSDSVSFASYLVRFRVKHPHDAQWLHMLLGSTSFWGYARSHALVNLQTNLNSTRYCKFPVPVPTPDEQREIARRVLEETGMVRDAIRQTNNEINLLREYRTRLIADVVTGKLDVRSAAARLPEEPDAEDDPALDGEELADAAQLDTEPEEVEA